jgi:uncharacterized protein (UPF0332 family)
VHTEKINPCFSKTLHKIFEVRQEGDYKELVEFSYNDADEFVKLAEEFLEGIKKIQ